MSDALVYVHITGGAAAILAGFVALVASKGEALHRAAGSAFFVAMVVMCTSAFVVAVERGQTINIFASTFTLYLLATAWVAARRHDGESGRFEAVALIAAVAIASSAVVVGGGTSKAWAPFFFGVAGLAGLAAFLDVTVIVRGGVAGAQRIARHLWRMTFAMFIATGSYFLGQPKFVPAILRETNLNFVPVIVVVALLFFWLARVLFTRWHRTNATPVAPSA